MSDSMVSKVLSGGRHFSVRNIELKAVTYLTSVIFNDLYILSSPFDIAVGFL